MTAPTARPDDLTADSWQEWPHNRWAFQHIDEILSTAVVPRGDGPLVELGDGDPLDPPGLDAELAACCTDGLLVLRGHEIRLERYLNGMTRETRHLLMSVSKSVTSAVFGRFVARGEIDVREPVARYVAALEGSAYGDATVQQTLDMTVAVAYDEAYHDPQSAVQRHDRSGGWRATPRRCAAGAFCRRLALRPLTGLGLLRPATASRSAPVVAGTMRSTIVAGQAHSASNQPRSAGSWRSRYSPISRASCLPFWARLSQHSRVRPVRPASWRRSHRGLPPHHALGSQRPFHDGKRSASCA